MGAFDMIWLGITKGMDLFAFGIFGCLLKSCLAQRGSYSSR